MKPASSLTGQQQIPMFSLAVAIVLAYDVQALLTKLLGGLLLGGLSLAATTRMLDIACGAGNWALDLAFACPALSVVGAAWGHAWRLTPHGMCNEPHSSSERGSRPSFVAVVFSERKWNRHDTAFEHKM